MSNDRVLVVFTGGTIGSRRSGDVIGLESGQTHRLLAAFAGESTTDSPPSFDVIEPLSILSEDARPADWATIAGAVEQALTDEHSGVIVTHGTDTLSYCATALSFALVNVAVPIVLVASDRPLDEPDANGHQNFRDAIAAIRQLTEGGVFVTFRNPDGRRLVHAGARLAPSTPLSHYFLSTAGTEVAYFDANDVLHRVSAIPHRAVESYSASTVFSPSVLLLRPYPGLDYATVDLTGCEAVVHETYHSGTACTAQSAQSTSISEFGRRCRDAGVPLFVGPMRDGVAVYETTQRFDDVGVIAFNNMRAETAYVKVSRGVGIGLRGEALTEFVCRDELAGEFATRARSDP